MSEAQAAGGIDRLPWLSDEPARKAPPKRAKRDITGWAAAAVLLVAGTSFWLGTRSQSPETVSQRPPISVAAPEEKPAPQQEVRIAPQPEVAQAPERQVRAEPAPQVRSIPQPVVHFQRREPVRRLTAKEKVEASAIEIATPAVTRAVAAPPRASTPLRPWSPRVVAGASGRLVQIGAYGSRLQAKQGWAKMVRAYPAVQRLPALVVDSRNSNGRHFFRFQIGTTSQAHSEVLCQRMQKIDLSCAVVGLPWKAKVER